LQTHRLEIENFLSAENKERLHCRKIALSFIPMSGAALVSYLITHLRSLSFVVGNSIIENLI
jgi:hypothetical protein